MLKITDASGRSWEVNLLPDAVYNVGRAKDNDIVLNDRRVSRRHAHVVAANGEIKIVDGFEAGGEVHRSINRVFINNVPQLEKILEPNDEIIIGESKLIFEEINSVKAPVPPSAEKTRAAILPSSNATEAAAGGVKYDDQPLGYTQMQISAGEIIGQRSNLSLETKIATPDELKDLRRKAKALDLLYEMSKTLGTVFDLKEIFAARRI
jgi:pSer/pThr/pTyr-binding forkhead associated (FHA) protein